MTAVLAGHVFRGMLRSCNRAIEMMIPLRAAGVRVPIYEVEAIRNDLLACVDDVEVETLPADVVNAAAEEPDYQEVKPEFDASLSYEGPDRRHL